MRFATQKENCSTRTNSRSVDISHQFMYLVLCVCGCNGASMGGGNTERRFGLGVIFSNRHSQPGCFMMVFFVAINVLNLNLLAVQQVHGKTKHPQTQHATISKLGLCDYTLLHDCKPAMIAGLLLYAIIITLLQRRTKTRTTDTIVHSFFGEYEKLQINAQNKKCSNERCTCMLLSTEC